MLVFTLPGDARIGDTREVSINGDPMSVTWTDAGHVTLHRREALDPHITLERDDVREIISTSSPAPHGLRQFWCEDRQHKWRIRYETRAKSTITVEAATAEEARAKFEAGDASKAEWLTMDEQAVEYTITEVNHAVD